MPSATIVPSPSPIVTALIAATPSPYIPSFPVPATSQATSQATSLIPTTPFASVQPSVQPAASGSPLSSINSNPAAVVTVGSTDKQIVQTTTPTIVGQAPPNVQVSIIIHSTTLINSQTQTDANGNYVFDVAAASKNLEPGKHTVTISYKDPQTGKIMTKTQSFVVAAPSQSPSSSSEVLALAAPYGSTNPYPITSPDATPVDSPVPSYTPVSTPALITKTISSSGSALPVSGHTSATFFLIFGGLFFILAGVGSFFVSHRRADD